MQRSTVCGEHLARFTVKLATLAAIRAHHFALAVDAKLCQNRSYVSLAISTAPEHGVDQALHQLQHFDVAIFVARPLRATG